VKSLAKLILLFFISACAKPRYVDGLETRLNPASGECTVVFTTEALCLRAQWVQFPSESTFGEMSLTFTDLEDSNRKLDPRASVAIVLWMPSMGHGSSPVTIERINVGEFRASDVFFIMPGPWDIRYQLKSGDDVLEEQIQKITI